MRQIIVCGPPHSGKSVFLSNLQRLLPVEHHMLIFGAPDGEWHWSNEADQNLVCELRQKKGFTDNFADNIVKAIEPGTETNRCPW
jgi:ABC-type iron transport system FetAB ATPase subunit